MVAAFLPFKISEALQVTFKLTICTQTGWYFRIQEL
jgi:hypothetical protein